MFGAREPGREIVFFKRRLAPLRRPGAGSALLRPIRMEAGGKLRLRALPAAMTGSRSCRSVGSARRWPRCGVGLRPSIPTSVSVIRPSRGCPDVIPTVGHGRLGLPRAPMIARIVAFVAGRGAIVENRRQTEDRNSGLVSLQNPDDPFFGEVAVFAVAVPAIPTCPDTFPCLRSSTRPG